MVFVIGSYFWVIKVFVFVVLYVVWVIEFEDFVFVNYYDVMSFKIRYNNIEVGIFVDEICLVI